ncbi:MAG TPA: ADP-ribosylglycohydrolase family protein [Chitinophagaceae bacterium]|nr:ADP-ribosylglycohydrolase family protein [Chitinophagaceae bacterium]
MRRINFLLLGCMLIAGWSCKEEKAGSSGGTLPEKKTLTIEQLRDKIRGGWAGQTIGVTYGGPTEFRYNGTFIQDYQPIVWYDGYLKKTMEEIPGLYDDVYMDLTFVDVIERLGYDAPVDSFAHAFAHAAYKLWHANQAARYNILNGIKAPESGHWRNNPHADDIDYQIEADYAGLMSPGMPNAASEISDKVGHIMNYGDGWYGGVYVGAMYALAFVSDDIHFIVNEALKTIPSQSLFYQCMADVIKWHKQYPDDWKQAWFELQKKWADDRNCPDGVFLAFNIDASINAAYILLGLLYGDGDYGKTLEIATRAGQDSDCNPSSAGGILGTMMGYSKIPDYWKMGLKDIEDMDFKYTTMSLNKVYEVGLKHALETVKRNGGTVGENEVTINVQAPAAVRFEKAFENMYPVTKVEYDTAITKEHSFEFEGTGFVLRGKAVKKERNLPEAVLEAAIYVDDQELGTYKFPTEFTTRRLEIAWKYELPNTKHRVRIVAKNIPAGYELKPSDYIVYSDKPPANEHK